MLSGKGAAGQWSQGRCSAPEDSKWSANARRRRVLWCFNTRIWLTSPPTCTGPAGTKSDDVYAFRVDSAGFHMMSLFCSLPPGQLLLESLPFSSGRSGQPVSQHSLTILDSGIALSPDCGEMSLISPLGIISCACVTYQSSYQDKCCTYKILYGIHICYNTVLVL